jgi:hypothetical protein
MGLEIHASVLHARKLCFGTLFAVRIAFVCVLYDASAINVRATVDVLSDVCDDGSRGV